MRNMTGAILAILCAIPPNLAGAQQEDDFTFRRVKVGEALPGKRITVQIDPAEQARRLAALPKVDPKPVRDHSKDEADKKTGADPGPAPTSSYAWFWDKVSPNIDDVDDRFILALASLAQGPGGSAVRAPRMQQMQQVAETYGTDILKATLDTNVSPALVLAVIGIESAGKSDAVSSAGAIGLMQLIPATAKRFGVTDSTDPSQNIRGGVAYLDWLLKEFDNDPLMVLAAYNAGEGAVKANGGVPPYAETRDYVPKVLAAWQVAQGLCLSPPELVTDPCVFKIIATGG
ncbi:MAG: lytic transglycosylase domain-containing protein [Tabrizicola sp.]|nr:lytic transglycosylase domain-containing protein [Tabrizicola sp.]